jgi:GH35 family endo-1,4-beta-xylanase
VLINWQSNATVDLWVDSVSLNPFTKDEWASHRADSTALARKKTVRLQATDSAGKPLAGAAVSLDAVRSAFPLGAAVSKYILTNTDYQSWFTSRFGVATFENEMKWYSTEPAPGREDYSVADAMMAFAKAHGIAVRGHNVFWDQPSQQPAWVQALPYPQLLAAASRRIRSVMSRYAGQVIGWDVVNENLHFDFYEGRFGWDASTAFYAAARLLDAGSTLMFLNEFNTLEQPGDAAALPGRYLQRLREIVAAYPENGAGMAIGLEGHFTSPNIPYMRAALDMLAQAGVPVWLTEVDVAAGPAQAQHLEEVLREAYAHPAVQGVVLWSAWHPEGCYVMCLTDNNFGNLPQGDVVDRLIAEWRATPRGATTDAQGYFEAQLPHGEYKVTVSHPVLNSSVSRSVKIQLSAAESEYFIDIRV